MEAKLAKNRHKGDRNGWLKDDALSLWNRLDQESCELLSALKDPDATFEQMANEAADVANFAMMVADVVLTRKSANARISEPGANT
jgi:NTP pyrophosphatase (non-canonical NTP hydrolase)